jgi:hypothetical protein
MRSRDQINEARYDQESTLLIGPSSKPFVVKKVLQSPYIADRPAKLEFSHTLSSSSLAELAQRCSTKSIRRDVQKKMQNSKVAVSLRKRMIAWTESKEPEEG